jgi:hypothetical protein
MLGAFPRLAPAPGPVSAGAWSSVTIGATNPLYAVWGSGPNEVWAVGGLGTVLHRNGATWSRVTTGTTNPLYAVWGSGPNDVCAMGAVTIMT